MAKYTVDYGHTLSGGDTGAGGNNLREEKLTREIGSLVVKKLRDNGHTIYPIELNYARTMAESLNYRVDKIIEQQPNQSISIHINAAANVSATGVEVWGDNLCKDMCIRISKNISTEFGLANRGFKNGVEDLALVGLYGQSNIPALLVECFFISNKDDCNKYNAERYAECIVAGILNIPINKNEKVEYEMENIVCYANSVDKCGAEFLASTLKADCRDARVGYDFNNGKIAKRIIAVGGDNPRKGEKNNQGKVIEFGFTGYTTHKISVGNRFDTNAACNDIARRVSAGENIDNVLESYKIKKIECVRIYTIFIIYCKIISERGCMHGKSKVNVKR